MGKSKKETKVEPWAPAQPYILDNLKDTKATYDANQPQLQAFSGQMQDSYGRLAPGAEAGVVAAQNLVNRNLSGANLAGNPFLEGIIAKTRRNVTDTVNGQFNGAGRFGSAANSGVLARELADSENGARYQDYSTERQIQQGSIGDAQNLMGGATGLLNNAAQLPWIGTAAQNGGTTQLSSPYSTRTEISKPSLLDTLGGVAKTAGSIAGTVGMFASDERIKNVRGQVGTDPNTGLPLYDYTYKGDDTPQVGVMAQDVEQVRPDAVAQGPDGIKAVDYGALGLPAPGDMASLRQDVPEIKRPKKGLIGTLRDDPTLSKPENAARLFWSRLAAASGSPLGQTVIGGRDDDLARADSERRFGIQEKQVDAMANYRQAMADRPPPGTQPRIIQRRDGSVMSVDPVSGAATMLSGPVQGLEPVVATTEGYQPRSKAIGKMPYQAHTRPSANGGRPGGVPPASAAKYRAEAAAAIARGADPAKVNARLAQIMGGQ